MTQVSHHAGSEGPRHDPYSFDEFKLKRPNGDTIVVHEGLLAWCRIERGGKVFFQHEGDDAAKGSLFATYAGVSFKAFEKAWHSLPERRLNNHFCGGRHRGYRDFKGASGYPGESFTICTHCGDVIDSEFDRSAVE